MPNRDQKETRGREGAGNKPQQGKTDNRTASKPGDRNKDQKSQAGNRNSQSKETEETEETEE